MAYLAVRGRVMIAHHSTWKIINKIEGKVLWKKLANSTYVDQLSSVTLNALYVEAL